jgi:hypothetical protein
VKYPDDRTRMRLIGWLLFAACLAGTMAIVLP